MAEAQSKIAQLQSKSWSNKTINFSATLWKMLFENAQYRDGDDDQPR